MEKKSKLKKRLIFLGFVAVFFVSFYLGVQYIPKNEYVREVRSDDIEQELKYDDIENISQDTETYIIEDSNARELTEEELEKYSTDELIYIKNEIYARHGLPFEDDELGRYFSKKEWYIRNLDVNMSNIPINDIERVNIEKLDGLIL